MQSVSPAIQRTACDEPAHRRPSLRAQVQQPDLGLPEHGAVVLFWVNPNIDQPRLLLPRGVPGSASFEVSPDNADLLDSLVASCVQYCCPTELSV